MADILNLRRFLLKNDELSCKATFTAFGMHSVARAMHSVASGYKAIGSGSCRVFVGKVCWDCDHIYSMQQ
jgi:hypothetical protein